MSSHRPGREVVLLKPPLFTVSFIIEQVLPHDRIFRFKQEVTVCTRHCTFAVVHWPGEEEEEKKEQPIHKSIYGEEDYFRQNHNNSVIEKLSSSQ